MAKQKETAPKTQKRRKKEKSKINTLMAKSKSTQMAKGGNGRNGDVIIA